MQEYSPSQDVIDSERQKPKSPLRWPVIAASIVFSFSAYAMVWLYGFVHWQIMFHDGKFIDHSPKEHVYRLLDILMALRVVFAVLAVIYAGLSFKQGPKLAAFIALVFAGIAIMTILMIM